MGLEPIQRIVMVA